MAEEAAATTVVVVMRVMIKDVITKNRKQAPALEQDGMLCSCGEEFCVLTYRCLFVCGTEEGKINTMSYTRTKKKSGEKERDYHSHGC